MNACAQFAIERGIHVLKHNGATIQRFDGFLSEMNRA